MEVPRSLGGLTHDDRGEGRGHSSDSAVWIADDAVPSGLESASFEVIVGRMASTTMPSDCICFPRASAARDLSSNQMAVIKAITVSPNKMIWNVAKVIPRLVTTGRN